MYRIGNEELEEVRRVIESKSLFRVGVEANGHQNAVLRFERAWGETIGTTYALCLSSGGTAALICALVGLGIGPGDEVIVPAYTWMASALAVCAVGAIPVFAEIDETMGLDSGDFERLCTPQTKAVLPVHIVGRPANMEGILNVARPRGIFVVEDACQADGGSYKGRRLGSWGDAGAFSFNDFKIMSCGEGGALVTNDRTLYERALVYHDAGITFRNYGQDLSIETFLGQQYRASELMGAVLLGQLRRLEGILRDLRRARTRFEEELGALPGLRIAPNNDSNGDCGVVAALQFDSEKLARQFNEYPGVNGLLPIDSGKHVYTNWTPLMEHKVGHHPGVNPFNFPANRELRTRYSADMCPRTLEILARTVYIHMNPDWTEAEIAARIAVCVEAARGL